MQNRGEDGACHEVFDCAIGKALAIPLGISSRSLPIARLAVFGLVDARQRAIPC